MSRGPGKWQRTILEAIEAAEGGPVVLTKPEDSHSTQNAIRRAATTLEAADKIAIRSLRIDDIPRLVVYDVDKAPNVDGLPSETTEAADIMGMDGKTYRRPLPGGISTPRPKRTGNNTVRTMDRLAAALWGMKQSLQYVTEVDSDIDPGKISEWRHEITSVTKELNRLYRLLDSA